MGGLRARPSARNLTLDAGALIAFERGSEQMRALVARALARSETFVLPAAALAQAWRGGRRQSRLARLLGGDLIVVEDLTAHRARAAGELCALRDTGDFADASVVLTAIRHGGVVATSDPADLIRLEPTLEIIRV